MKSHETAMLTLRSKWADLDLCSEKEMWLEVCTEAREDALHWEVFLPPTKLPFISVLLLGVHTANGMQGKAQAADFLLNCCS